MTGARPSRKGGVLRPRLDLERLPTVPAKKTPRAYRGHLDRGLVLAATLAAKSPKLTPAEKRELTALVKKHKPTGRGGWTMADRARCVGIVPKGPPESMPGRPKPSPDVGTEP